MTDVPQYEEILQWMRDSWPRHSDYNPRTRREEVMLEIVATQIGDLAFWVGEKLKEETNDKPET